MPYSRSFLMTNARPKRLHGIAQTWVNPGNNSYQKSLSYAFATPISSVSEADYPVSTPYIEAVVDLLVHYQTRDHGNSSFRSPTFLNLCIPETNNPVSMDYTEAVADLPMYWGTQPPSSQSATLAPLCNELEYIGLPPGFYPALTMHMYHQNRAVHEEMHIATTGGFVSEMLPTDSPFVFSNSGEFSHPPGRTEAELHPTNRGHIPDGHMHFSNNTVASPVDPNPSLIMVEEFTGNSNVEIHGELYPNPGARDQPQSSRVATDRLLMVSRQRRKHPGKSPSFTREVEDIFMWHM
ncbi:hypothetical protein K435DRAFT_794544 [Dendrothele bispora CBS 962.96]|uniref:Uncharacterized protein n=1 Tax=Dendrothele bispora (strain CBS 962.96) TaxID=1314807 RepID=A0A4S8MBS0_DENBC|nr:hypothetical protein K435DRAFT_794544 [Dendrothele bispora CBS 962.96]